MLRQSFTIMKSSYGDLERKIKFSREVEEKNIRRIILTFDLEDFINRRSMKAYLRILRLLRKYDFKALFFITGHTAERLALFPQVLELFRFHEIGYHSSSHSVRPSIFEYTDVENYEEAYQSSIERETAHINPLTGEVEGVGGIEFLRDLFPNKRIVSFRAPGLCWSPPHLEALKKLGIEFDFSADISSRPAYYKGITFYPYPIVITGFVYYRRVSLMLNGQTTVLASHPSFYVNSNHWDFAYHKGNPDRLVEVKPRSRIERESLFLDFEFLLKQISLLQRVKFLEVAPYLSRSRENLTVTRRGVERCYEKSMAWPRDFFGFEPRFLRSHFFRYFDVD